MNYATTELANAVIDTVSVRTAILMNGLKLDPEHPESFYKAAVAVSRSCLVQPGGLDSQPWNLYFFVPDAACAVDAVAIQDWLVDATVACTGNNEFPFESIDPADWISGLKNTWAKFPDSCKSEDSTRLVNELVDRASTFPVKTMNQLREAITAKARAMAALKYPTTTTGELQ